MPYLCLKAINLGNRRFEEGDTIPNEAVRPERVNRLQNYGYIKVMPSDGEGTGVTVQAQVASVGLTVPIYKNSGDGDAKKMDLQVTENEVQTAFEILQSESKIAVGLINEVKDENVLIIVHALDSRSTVKTAAMKKASALGHE